MSIDDPIAELVFFLATLGIYWLFKRAFKSSEKPKSRVEIDEKPFLEVGLIVYNYKGLT